MFIDTTTPSAFRPLTVDPARTAIVEYNPGFASRCMPWQIRCYGLGRCTKGTGVPCHYRDEARARTIAATWIATGIAAADQGAN